jgi:uncharacterized HAD superfamily protein
MWSKTMTKPQIKIGVDLDGVVFDSETTFRVYEEIFDIDKNQNKLTDRSEAKYQQRYSWSEEEQKEFEKYWREISQSSGLMSGFKKVYQRLKEDGVELIAITARGLNGSGNEFQFMEDDAKRILTENGIVFDKYYWKQKDKLEVCLKENVDYMIDDDYRIISKIADHKIRTMYFRDTGIKKLEENEYIKEVNNWGDVYRIIHNSLNGA